MRTADFVGICIGCVVLSYAQVQLKKLYFFILLTSYMYNMRFYEKGDLVKILYFLFFFKVYSVKVSNAKLLGRY